MADTKSAEVFKLLDSLTKVGTVTTTEIDAQAFEPESNLVNRWEPEFQDGYEFETSSGNKLTLKQIWDAYVAGEQIMFVGPSGCGKSTIAFHLLDEANEIIREKNRKLHMENLSLAKAGRKEFKPYIPLPYELSHYSCHEATRSEELMGTVKLKIRDDGSREAIIVRGAVTEAWTKGKTLILEEMDFAPPGVWGETHQFFDMRTKETEIYINGPERIKKNNRFRVMATANTLGQGENQIEFAGTQVLNRAFLNRFTYVVKVSWLPREQEARLIYVKTALRQDIVYKLVDAAKQARDAYDAGTCDTVISTRELLAWARECVREAKRHGEEDAKKMNAGVFWKEVVLPSAYPTFLNRIVDQNTRDMFEKYLSIR
jgi:MoxR-like ATPase